MSADSNSIKTYTYSGDEYDWSLGGKSDEHDKMGYKIFFPIIGIIYVVGFILIGLTVTHHLGNTLGSMHHVGLGQPNASPTLHSIFQSYSHKGDM